MPPDLVGTTGVTGRLGGRVARQLAALGVEQRLLARDPSRVPALPKSTVHTAAYADREAVSRALHGVPTVFFVSAAEAPDRLEHHFGFVDGAADAGVRHVVYTSFVGAAPDATLTLARDHFSTEERIRASGMAWTFLRNNAYADLLPYLADESGVIRGPAGDGRVAAVAIADVADVATAVLMDPRAHAGRTYEPTGPDAMTLADAARLLTEVSGRPVRFVDETVEEAYQSREQYGAEQWQLDAWVSTYLAIARGELERVTTDVEVLTGHPGTPLRAVLEAAP